MRVRRRETVVVFTLYALTCTVTAAQQPVQLSPAATTVAAKVSALRVGGKISVVFPHAAERYGTFQSSRQADFTFHDVDRNVDATVTYAEVKKVKDGYGGYNSVSGKHTDRTRAYIAIGVAVALIVGVIVAVAAAKN